MNETLKNTISEVTSIKLDAAKALADSQADSAGFRDSPAPATAAIRAIQPGGKRRDAETDVPLERQAPEFNTAAMVDAKVARIANQKATGQYIAYNKAGAVLGWLNYRDVRGNRDLYHTETNPIFRGKGVANDVTKHAFDEAARQGVPVDPSCWYAAEWVQRNPSYAKYVAQPAY